MTDNDCECCHGHGKPIPPEQISMLNPRPCAGSCGLRICGFCTVYIEDENRSHDTSYCILDMPEKLKANTLTRIYACCLVRYSTK